MRAFVLPSLAVFALGVWACGGDVVVDGKPTGSGGSGAGSGDPSSGPTDPSTGAQPTSSGPQPTTSSGPVADCGCDDVCKTANACGFVPDDCETWCNTLEPAERSCICNKPHCDLAECFGTDGEATACMKCIAGVIERFCDTDLAACSNTPGCFDVIDCHFECTLEPSCVAGCDAQSAGDAVAAAHAALACPICDGTLCTVSCTDGSEQLYCR